MTPPLATARAGGSAFRRRGAPVGVREPERRKAEILDAAVKVLGLRGAIATSIDEIAATAGISKGTFYHYFDSREALLVSVAQRHFVAVEARARQLFGKAFTDGDQAIRAFVAIVFGTKIPGLELCETVALVSRASKSDSALVSYSRLIEDFLEIGAGQGLWAGCETPRHALFLAGGMLAVIGFCRISQTGDGEVIDMVSDQFARALHPLDNDDIHNVGTPKKPR